MPVGVSSVIFFQKNTGRNNLKLRKLTFYLSNSKKVMTDNETIYKVNGDDFLKKHHPEKSFFLKKQDGIWHPVSVGKIWVSNFNKVFKICALVDSVRHTYEISEEQWKKWLKLKSDNKRMSVLIDAADDLKIRKIPASKHIDLRVRKDFYDKIAADAEICKLPISVYCRYLLEGSQPKAAFTDEEKENIIALVNFQQNLKNYANAMKAVSYKIPAEQRPFWIIEGVAYTEYRRIIKETLLYIDKVINKIE